MTAATSIAKTGILQKDIGQSAMIPPGKIFSVRRYLPDLKAALAELKSDPEIAKLHDETVRLHLAKRDALMATPEFVALYDRLKSLPPYPPEEWALMKELGLAE